MTNNLLPTLVWKFNRLNIKGSTALAFLKEIQEAFDDIPVDSSSSKKLKREYSLPGGVPNWNISNNIDRYLDFEDNAINIDLGINNGDRIVPEGHVRTRCPSGSSSLSFSSFNDDSGSNFHSVGVKSFSTVFMDSGSTHYPSDSSSYNQKLLGCHDPEEIYQNIHSFVGEVSEKPPSTKNVPSLPSLPSASSDSCVELTVLQPYRPCSSKTSNVLVDRSTFAKRRLDSCSDDDEVLIMKQTKVEFTEGVAPSHRRQNRIKNNIASRNCRKTREGKQKDMEVKVCELEKEREALLVKLQELEESIKAHTALFHAIMHNL